MQKSARIMTCHNYPPVTKHGNGKSPNWMEVSLGKSMINCIILAVSCPYSRAEHIPCQNGWEISGNCADPVQVNFLFRTVCQVFLFFWHVRCRLHVFFPSEDPSFEQFLMMAFSWKWSLIRTFRTNWIWEVRWTILFSSLQYIFPRKEYDAIPGVR